MILFKTQLACLAILWFLSFNYFFETFHSKCKKDNLPSIKLLRKERINFFQILRLGFLNIVFDIASVYTVNHLETCPSFLNSLAHCCFLVSTDITLYTLFIYILKITGFYPKNKKKKLLIYSPLITGIIAVIILTPSLRYNIGKTTNYSMGGAAYVAFIIGGLCVISSILIFYNRIKYIEIHRRVLILYFLFVILSVMVIQWIFPETLISSLGITLVIMGIYLNEDNPAMKKLKQMHKDMTNSYANLVEDRDENTGGHIRRVTAYVSILAEEMQHRKLYKNILTKDWISNLEKVAPLHDIGKISVPDAILQKPGPLTEEERKTMQYHTVKGAEIINRNFKNFDDLQYKQMALEVAKYHHEKWNGKGYPEGIRETEIPLCARIMALADVFDAISQNRCYRAAMPLEKCFKIIEEGRGSDFDPELTDIFLSLREEVEKICIEFREIDI